MKDVRLTHIGGPTVLIEVGGWRLLTDPTFDPPGRSYRFGWGTRLAQARRAGRGGGRAAADRRRAAHPRPSRRQPRPAGRALLPEVGVVVTTASGARRLGGTARGLDAWGTTRLESAGRPAIEITATPCRHGPPLSHPIVGDVIGFSLRWEGQTDGVLWISGDTVMYEGMRDFARRVLVDTAILHLGGVQFPVTGPLRYTMTARDAVELCQVIEPRVAIPVHYEGWRHFREGRAAIEQAWTGAPEDFRRRVRWLSLGERVTVD